jgi:FMN reductase (NADPH)
MNSTIDVLRSHRSIRQFRDEPVLPEHIREAVRAGQAASTSSAIQAYCALQVTDPTKRARLVELTGGQPYVAQAGAFFAICADTRRLKIACESTGQTYDQHLEGFVLGVIDATMFAQNMVIAFESLGYGICYIGGLRNNLPVVDELLKIPDGVYPLFGLCVGVPDQQPTHRPRMDVDAALYVDSFPSDEELQNSLHRYDEVYTDYLVARGAQARSWSQVMSRKLGKPMRPDLASYYTSKGARLD